MKKILYNINVGDASPTVIVEWTFNDGGFEGLNPYITKFNVFGQGVTAAIPLLTTIVGQITDLNETIPMVEIANVSAASTNGIHVVCSNQVGFEGAVRITPGLTYALLAVHSANDPDAAALSFTTFFQWEISWL